MVCDYSGGECNGLHNAAEGCFVMTCRALKEQLWQCAGKCGISFHASCVGVGRNNEETIREYMLPLCACCQKRIVTKCDYGSLYRKHIGLAEKMDATIAASSKLMADWKKFDFAGIADSIERRLNDLESMRSTTSKCSFNVDDLERYLDERAEKEQNKFSSILGKIQQMEAKSKSDSDMLIQRVISSIQATFLKDERAFKDEITKQYQSLDTKFDMLAASASRDDIGNHRLNDIIDDVKQLVCLAEGKFRSKPPPDVETTILADELANLSAASDNTAQPPAQHRKWFYFIDPSNVRVCKMLASDFNKTTGWRCFLSRKGKMTHKLWRPDWSSYDEIHKLRVENRVINRNNKNSSNKNHNNSNTYSNPFTDGNNNRNNNNRNTNVNVNRNNNNRINNNNNSINNRNISNSTHYNRNYTNRNSNGNTHNNTNSSRNNNHHINSNNNRMNNSNNNYNNRSNNPNFNHNSNSNNRSNNSKKGNYNSNNRRRNEFSSNDNDTDYTNDWEKVQGNRFAIFSSPSNDNDTDYTNDWEKVQGNRFAIFNSPSCACENF